MGKISDEVKIYVKQRPHVQAALEKGILNYSATARLMKRHIRGSEEAIKMSLMRLARHLRKRRGTSERKILSLLRNSSLEIKNKVAVVIARGKINIPTIASIEGPSAFTHMVNEADMKKLKRKGTIKIDRGLDIITILHQPEIEEVPGVIAFLLDALAAENINVYHLYSCYNDTILVLHNTDTMKAYKTLNRITE